MPTTPAAPAAPETEPRLDAVAAIRYIKLGQGGNWARQAIAQGTLPLWYRRVDHSACAAGDWEQVRAQLAAAGRKAGKISDGLREIRDFYELGQRCLWVTIADGLLWWAFAASDVVPSGETGEDRPSRFRRTLDGWRCHSLTGEPLTVRSLSTSLTQVAAYRGTICEVARPDYLLRRLRGEAEPLTLEAQDLLARLEELATRMIAQLHWREFEVMVDLIFANGGWRRRSVLGGSEADIDLELVQPTTGDVAWVQVKSKANQKVLDDYLARHRRNGTAQRFYFVCHSPKGELGLPDEAGLHLWTGQALARSALGAGLFSWLIDRTR